MINKEKFITRMLQHWEQRLSNVSNPSLKHTWAQIVDGFNDLISNDSDETRRTQWIALSPKTGTGKTQSLILYNAMLAEEYSKVDHPGTLIVTQFTKEADDIAEMINSLCNQQVAIAYHTQTKSRYMIEDLKESPVLVITHSAYLNAMDNSFVNGGATWERLNCYLDRSRKLVVIDEALNAVEDIKIELDDLRFTHGSIPDYIFDKFPKEKKLIEEVMAQLTSLKESVKKDNQTDRLITDVFVEGDTVIDFTDLRRALSTVKFEHLLNRHDLTERKKIRMRHIEVLKNVEALLNTWMYYSKVQTRSTLNSSRLLIQDNCKGSVILDATANSDRIYDLFNDVQQVIPPVGARSYENVTMKVSYGHKTGKTFMNEQADDLCRELINQLNEELPPNSKVLIVTHKSLEMTLTTFAPNFEMKVDHWGAITGSNKYQDFDTVVLFGLPYRPTIWSTNTFAAYQGHESISDDWLQNKDDARSYKNYSDIKSALATSKLIVDTVQAINRIRCRKTIDDQGNCMPSTVYLMLPSKEVGNEIALGIKNEMPKVNIVNWIYKDDLLKRKPRKSKAEDSLKLFARDAMVGEYSLSEVASMIKVSPSTIKSIASKLRDESSMLFQILSDLGMSYIVKQVGNNKHAYLVKV